MDARHFLQVTKDIIEATTFADHHHPLSLSSSYLAVPIKFNSVSVVKEFSWNRGSDVDNPVSNRSLILPISRNEKDGKFHNIIQPNLYVSSILYTS